MLGRSGTAKLFSPADTLLFCLVVLFGAALRFRGLGEDSLWVDEAATWGQTRTGELVRTIVATAGDTYPPLYNLLALIPIRLVGPTEWALRVPAAVVGTLSILAIYWLTEMVGGRRAGIIAALLLALAPFAIFYSQEARAYSLLMLASMLYAGCSYKLYSAKSVWMAMGLVASGFMLLYSHPYGMLSWVSISAITALLVLRDWGWQRLFGFVALQFLIVLLFAPWILVVLRVMSRMAHDGSWLAIPTWKKGFDVIQRVGGGLPALVAIFSAAALALVPFGNGDNVVRRGAWPILATAFLGPIILGMAYSIFVDSIFADRYFIACLPPALVIAAVGLARVADTGRLGSVAVAAVAVVFCMASTGVPTTLRHQENWRGAAAYLDAEMMPGDCLIIQQRFVRRALEYYRTKPSACTVVNLKRASTDIPDAALVYVLLSHAEVKLGDVTALLDRSQEGSVLTFGNRIKIARLKPKQTASL